MLGHGRASVVIGPTARASLLQSGVVVRPYRTRQMHGDVSWTVRSMIVRIRADFQKLAAKFA